MEIEKLNDEKLEGVSGGMVLLNQYEDRDGNTHIKKFGVINLCSGCGECVMQCPTGAIYLDDNDNAHINAKECILCYNCADHCYLGSIGEVETVIKKQAA